MNSIKKRINAGLCTGCGLCVEDPSEMLLTPSGFLNPKTPIADSISSTCCPAIKISNHSSNERYDPIWGNILTCRQGHSTDPEVRMRSSSGGVITQLGIYLLSSMKVDGIIHVGASASAPATCQTNISTSREELLSNAGSRYSPSSPLSLIRSVIGDGRKYAVIARPCDIAAIRSLTKVVDELSLQFPYLLSFFCAGVPSQNSTSELLTRLGTDEGHVTKLRYRGNGWPGLTEATLVDGSTRSLTYNEAWGTILNQSLLTRCKICADGTGEAADIVCGDAWLESDDGYPSFNERDGLSLTIARTKSGLALLDEAETQLHVHTSTFPLSRLANIQPYQFNRRATSLPRLLAFLFTHHFTITFRGYSLLRSMTQTSLATQIRTFLGSIRRFHRRG